MLGTLSVGAVVLIGTEIVDHPALGDVVGVIQHEAAHPPEAQPLSHGSDIVAGGGADLFDGQHVRQPREMTGVIGAQRGLRYLLRGQETHGMGLAPVVARLARGVGNQELFGALQKDKNIRLFDLLNSSLFPYVLRKFTFRIVGTSVEISILSFAQD